MMKKTLKELTVKNNFMFGAVMCDEDNCKGLLERVLQVPIQRVEVYVIFICDFDPFGERKYCYTFANYCKEVPNLEQGDGSTSIFLSTKGENRETVSEDIVKFLEFVGADLLESEKDFGDEFVKKLQKSVQNVKNSREMEERYMLFEEYGEVSEELNKRIMGQSDIEILKVWHKFAAKTESVEQFIKDANIV